MKCESMLLCKICFKVQKAIVKQTPKVLNCTSTKDKNPRKTHSKTLIVACKTNQDMKKRNV